MKKRYAIVDFYKNINGTIVDETDDYDKAVKIAKRYILADCDFEADVYVFDRITRIAIEVKT